MDGFFKNVRSECRQNVSVSSPIPLSGAWKVALASLLFTVIFSYALIAAPRPPGSSPAGQTGESAGSPVAESLGIHFVSGSQNTVLLERDGKTYLINLTDQTVREQGASNPAAEPPAQHLTSVQAQPGSNSNAAKIFATQCADCHGPNGNGTGRMKTPNFHDPSVQAGLSETRAAEVIRDGKAGTAMPAWRNKMSDEDIASVTSFVKSLGSANAASAQVSQVANKHGEYAYVPADDYLFSLPTGRHLDRHGFYFNFTHRFVYTPTFSGPGGGDTLAGLDDFAVSSFGLRYGITKDLSVSVYRSPSIISRPIEFGLAYNFSDEHKGNPLNAAIRFSVDGQNNFGKNYTPNIELILSRTLTRRSQIYVVPTISFQARQLIAKPGTLASIPPDQPGFNTFVLAAGGAFDIRPTVALVAEVFPTLVNGPELGIHRPAFAFGIQKRVFHHAFTLGFSNSPGTVVSQRAGTRATFLGQPSADTPGGLFVGFDLMRQIY